MGEINNGFPFWETTRYGAYDIIIGFYWIIQIYAFTIIRSDFPPEARDHIIIWSSLAPGFVFSILPYIRSHDIHKSREGIEKLQINRIWAFPILLFILLSMLPLSVLQYMKDFEAYLTSSIMAGSLYFGLSLHYLETGNTIHSVAFTVDSDLRDRLRKAAKITNRGAAFTILGGIILIFCGVVFHYDLTSYGFGESFSFYVFQRSMSIFGNSSFLWGVLQTASVSRWYLLYDD